MPDRGLASANIYFGSGYAGLGSGKRNSVKWLVIDLVVWHGDATFEKKDYQGSSLLDDYIRDRFEGRARFGR